MRYHVGRKCVNKYYCSLISMRWINHVAHMSDIRSLYNLGVGKKILKWILK